MRVRLLLVLASFALVNCLDGPPRDCLYMTQNKILIPDYCDYPVQLVVKTESNYFNLTFSPVLWDFLEYKTIMVTFQDCTFNLSVKLLPGMMSNQTFYFNDREIAFSTVFITQGRVLLEIQRNRLKLRGAGMNRPLPLQNCGDMLVQNGTGWQSNFSISVIPPGDRFGFVIEGTNVSIIGEPRAKQVDRIWVPYTEEEPPPTESQDTSTVPPTDTSTREDSAISPTKPSTTTPSFFQTVPRAALYASLGIAGALAVSSIAFFVLFFNGTLCAPKATGPIGVL